MWHRLPWRYVVSRVARARGFTDPIALMARLQRFGQPAEVSEPIELLRAGVAFHARGLLNARTFQHNLDWVWPFWVERQFDPHDPAFIPRAFSITHVNLTHRNWTAVGQPDLDWLPVVDPRGLVTPLFDGWSLDAWLLPDAGPPLFPSRAPDADAEQRWVVAGGAAVVTSVRGEAGEIASTADVAWAGGRPVCRLRVSAKGTGGWLAVAVRPANPEGVSLVHEIARSGDRALSVERTATVEFDRPPERVAMSEFRHGDVLIDRPAAEQRQRVTCDVGLATAAALFRLGPDGTAAVTANVPLPAGVAAVPTPVRTWDAELAGLSTVQIPDEQMRFLFDAAVRSLVLHAPGEVYPGPFTYKRFWFRDAAFILAALLAVGDFRRVRRAIDRFPQRQLRNGYFRSQEGEWDSNGAALWIIERYCRLAGEPLPRELAGAVARGADWIIRKRLPDDLAAPHAGLLPAGFSAEHLGLNDFYYWDDFWCAAGLRAAAGLGGARADAWRREADLLLAAVERSLAGRPHIPASPHRRLDSGAVGSLAASYPLALWEPRDPRLLATADYLHDHCTVHGGFFQDMIHSGVNAYLTLHLAQVYLRAGDRRYWPLVRAAAELASPTGQWPEAIHPLTRGGCMGDGHHVWAAAEWVLMGRSLFVREEGDRLVLGSGLPPEWLAAELKFGPTPTPYGPLTVRVAPAGENNVRVSWQADWRGSPPKVEVVIAGKTQTVDGSTGAAVVPLERR